MLPGRPDELFSAYCIAFNNGNKEDVKVRMSGYRNYRFFDVNVSIHVQ